MTESRVRNELTEGDLVRPLIRLAWPMVVIQLLQVAYNVADTVWLGALSADAVGALSLAFPLIFFLISIGGGFTEAGSILVAQYTGDGGEREAGEVAGQTLTFVTLVAVGVGVLGFVLTRPMLALLPTDPETATAIVPLAADYMRVFFLGTPFLFGFFVFVSLLRGYGNTRAPMLVMVVSVAVNVALDPLLIFGYGPIPAMGIEGAAAATVLARMVASVLGLYVLFGTDAGPTIRAPDLAPDLGRIGDIVSLGVPSALEQSSSSLAMIVLTAMIATFPPAVVAAYGLGNRLISLIFLPAMGMGQAINAVVGQNLGAGRPDRAERAVEISMGLVGGVLLVAAGIAAAFPEPIVGAFLSTGTDRAAETVAHGSDYLRIAATMFVFTGVLQVALGTFRGAGNTKTALAFSLVTLWLARVPATYYLVFELGWGATGIWTAVVVGDVVGAIAAVAWLLRGTWATTYVERSSADREAADGGTVERRESAAGDGDD